MVSVQGKNNSVRSTRGIRRHLTADEVKQMQDLRSSGDSYTSIARHFGVAYETVRYRCDEQFRQSARDRLRGRQRPDHLRRTFSITEEIYRAMLDAQNGVCAICEQAPDSRRLAVDHDHSCCPGRKTCGKCLRGLLCNRCNRRLEHGLELGRTFLSIRENNYVHLWRKRIARERSNPWDEIRERAA